jgi:uncharacterized protein
MYYLILADDRPDAAARRQATRPQHLRYLASLQDEGRLLLAGPRLVHDAPDPAAGVSGSVIVAAFDSLEAAHTWAAADPYAEADVFQSVRIEPMIKALPA